MAECNFDFDFDFDDHSSEETNTVPKNHRAINKENISKDVDDYLEMPVKIPRKQITSSSHYLMIRWKY